jgi:hypothetical protein
MISLVYEMLYSRFQRLEFRTWHPKLGTWNLEVKNAQNTIFGLMVEPDEGIQAKMTEVKMYTDMLEKLKRGKGV